MNEKRKLIGVLINNLDTDYQRAIWAGIDEAAREHDVNVLFLDGGSLGATNSDDIRRNTIHQFILSESFDGFIFVSTTISGLLGFQGVIDKFKPLWDTIPVVNIGPSSEGISSVMVDNRIGIRQTITHLIEVHHKSKFLFMGGSNKNSDSIERKESFVETLADYGLQPVEDGILVGLFMYTDTQNALSAWLERKIPFDAIVAANDSMAIACIELLRNRGYRVPEDIAVTGFDDSSDACFLTPPLTTVKQPVKDIALNAMHHLYRVIENQEKHENVKIPTELVIRQSCGCLSSEVQNILNPDILGVDPGIFQELEMSFKGISSDPLDSTAFLQKFLGLVRNRESDSSWFVQLGNVITLLERSLWQQPDSAQVPVPVLSTREMVLHQARILLKLQAESRQANIRIEFANKNHNFQYDIANLIGAFSLEKLLRSMPIILRNIGIASCFLSFFVPETRLNRSRFVLGYHDGKDLILPPDEIEFDTKDFFPRNLIPDDERFNFFVEMLFHEDQLLGVLVMNINPGNAFITNALMSQIRSALRSSMLMDELRDKDARLNATFIQLQKRADELENANRMIQQNQQQLVLSEKMASLGRLTAGMAHEMNTPLATAMASMSEIDSLIKEYHSSAGDPEVTREDHLAIADEMVKMLDLSHRSVDRAAGFIRSIKNQTRTGAVGETGVTFDFGKMVKDTMVLLGHAVRRGHCEVEIREPEYPVMVTGKPEKIAQVITNLAINAIDAMSPEGGTLGIAISVSESNVVLSISDTGCGIENENLLRIFEPFYTTKPYGVGTGLGLTIVHDIIKGECQGTIAVKSTPGLGTCFTITLPLKKE